MTVRTRFAPSPTGALHVGSARTGLYNYLFARHHKGSCILRIEDTDQERSTEESVKTIIEGFRWLGVEYDEAPIFQSKRLDIYHKYAKELVDKGYAQEEVGDKGKAILFKCPPGKYTWDDLVLDRIEKEGYNFIMIKSDGYPTYNFACVVDDHLMEITHVIRGIDHVSNTAVQLALYEAFDWEPPKFAHIPMILGGDGEKLSKRHGAVSVTEYRELGFMPEAVVNFIALIGWSPGEDREIMTRKELVDFFTVERCKKAAAQFNLEKLTWMNKQYLMNTPVETLAEAVKPFMERAGHKTNSIDKAWLAELIKLYHDRMDTYVHFVEQIGFFLHDGIDYRREDVESVLQKPGVRGILEDSVPALESANFNDLQALETALRGYCESKGIGFGKYAQPLRVAATGTRVSASLFDTLRLLGRDKVVKRVKYCIKEFLSHPV